MARVRLRRFILQVWMLDGAERRDHLAKRWLRGWDRVTSQGVHDPCGVSAASGVRCHRLTPADYFRRARRPPAGLPNSLSATANGIAPRHLQLVERGAPPSFLRKLLT
jgi:hypothetical protein